jgi:hypothetical protein
MGRFLTFLRKIVGGTVSPPCLLRKSNFAQLRGLRMAADVAWLELRRGKRIDIPAFKP